MAMPSNVKRFHLVLAHDITDKVSTRQSVFRFWSTRFPGALITDFPFLEEASSNVSFLDRAQSFLLTIREARDSYGRGHAVSPDDHLPCIFVCHGLGGSLVKQVLVLASLDWRFARYTTDAALLVLFDTPEASEDMAAWQIQVCRLLAVSDLGSCSASNLFNELPEALEQLHRSFSVIQRHHSVFQIRLSDADSEDSQDKTQTPAAQAPWTGYILADEANLWNFTPGDSTTERVCDLVSQAVKGEMQPVSKQFHDFMQLLRKVDSNNYQLEFSQPFNGSTMAVVEHATFREWRNINREAPNILYLRTPQGIDSAVIALHLIETLETSITDCAIISFSFNKRDLRTQPITTFYVSLIRQLLLSQSSGLFRRVSAISDWVEGEQNLSYEIFRSLFLSILKGASRNPIICVLNAVQDCAGFNIDHMVDLTKEFRRLSDGILKVIVLSEESIYGTFQANSPDVCRHIDMSTGSCITEFITTDIKSQIEALAKTSPHWRACQNEIIEKLCTSSIDYMQATTSMRLLSLKHVPSTRNAALDAIKNLPSSRDDLYAAAIDQCESECPFPLKPLLQWVMHSIRPLFLSELAVVIGLAAHGSSSMNTLRLNIPLDVLNDIRKVKATVIKMVGLQVHPFHKSLIPGLDQKWRLIEEDANSVMLSTCLDYLEMIMLNVPAMRLPSSVGGTCRSSEDSIPESPSEGSDQGRSGAATNSTGPRAAEVAADEEEHSSAGPPANRNPDSPKLAFDDKEREEESQSRLSVDLALMTGIEYGLVEYAVTRWPQHYKRARNREMLKGRVLNLFSKAQEVKAWSDLYQKFACDDTDKFKTLGSLLNIGCRFGLLDIVKDIIAGTKAAGNSRDVLSEALDLAVVSGHEDIVSLLIEEGAESDEAPSLAAEYGFLGILQLIIKANPAMAKVKDKLGRQPFLAAALSGNENIALYLMAIGSDDTAAVGSNTIGLQVSAMTGQLRLLRELLDAGSDIHGTRNKSSALMLAAAGGFDDIVRLLLSRGARIDDRDSDGETALYRAVKHGHISTCNLLLADGADIHIKTIHDLSPIHVAASNGYLDILQKLLDPCIQHPSGQTSPAKAGIAQTQEDQEDGEGQAKSNQADVYDSSVGVCTPLELAASNGHLEATRVLLNDDRYNLEKSRATALIMAANYGFALVVEELLMQKITTVMKDTNGNNALHLATQEQYPDIVAKLLGSNLESARIFHVDAQNDSEWTPLHLAARSGRLITVQALIDAEASVDIVNSSHENALHISAYHGHVWVVNALMDHLSGHPGDLRPEHNVKLMRNLHGETPFNIAVAQGHYDVAKSLIDKTVPGKPTDLQGQKNALIESVNQGRPDLVWLLLQHEWDVNANDGDGQTALHLAAQRGRLSIMELLISHGADCNVKNDNGETPLHRATQAGKDAVTKLLNNGANVDAKDSQDVTPLWRASYDGSEDAVEALLESVPKPDLHARRSIRSGWTPLHACFDNPGITELLLKAGADPMVRDENGDPPFFEAADFSMGHETIRKYIDVGIDVNAKNQNGITLIHLAAKAGTFDTVKLLHRNGADILLASENGETPLHWAATRKFIDHNETLKYLLQQDVDLEADCPRFGTPLMAAAATNESATTMLLQRGAKVNAISESCETHNALQTAASEGTIGTVKVLTDAGADTTLRGGSFGSALCAAVASENEDIVMFLLDKDKDINYAGGPRGSALELALSCNSFQTAALFLERGADVNVVSKGKHGTALIAAVDVGDINAVERLLKLKADVNLLSASGKSPLQVAVRRGRQNIVEVLIENGAALDYRDKHGNGVLSHAISHQSFDLLPYLLQQPRVDIDHQDDFGRTPLIHATIQGHAIVDDILARKPKVNIQDRWGQTALTHAVRRDYEPLVSSIIAAHVDPCIQDIRGRDALYWAALRGSEGTFSKVWEAMLAFRAPDAPFQLAVNAATAANNREFVWRLLEKVGSCEDQTDDDGWTAAYTAHQYNRDFIAYVIMRAAIRNGRMELDSTTPVQPSKHPTQWHPTDMSGYLTRQADSMSITVLGEPNFEDAESRAMVRADYPMVPNKDGIYYFEVTLVNTGSEECICGVGFCDEAADFHDMLGWQEGSWGYHSDDGNLFWSGQRSFLGDPYGLGFDEGSIIGCGVNFNRGTAFYTQKGKVIGHAFTDVRGKLYPAVSLSTRMVGCTLTARFWDYDESARNVFEFKGPYDGPATLQPSRRYKDECGAEQAENSDASVISTSSEDRSN